MMDARAEETAGAAELSLPIADETTDPMADPRDAASDDNADAGAEVIIPAPTEFDTDDRADPLVTEACEKPVAEAPVEAGTAEPAETATEEISDCTEATAEERADGPADAAELSAGPAEFRTDEKAD